MGVEYRVTGMACPAIVSRLIGLFAAQAIVLERIEVTRHGDCVSVTIVHAVPYDAQAERFADKMRAIVTVTSVAVYECPAYALEPEFDRAKLSL